MRDDPDGTELILDPLKPALPLYETTNVVCARSPSDAFMILVEKITSVPNVMVVPAMVAAFDLPLLFPPLLYVRTNAVADVATADDSAIRPLLNVTAAP